MNIRTTFFKIKNHFYYLCYRFYTAADSVHSSFDLPKDQRFPKVIVNEMLIKKLGFASAEAALGQRFDIGWHSWQPEIVGVVKDFVTNPVGLIIVGIILLAIYFLNKYIYATPAGRDAYDRIFLKFPIFGNLVTKNNIYQIIFGYNNTLDGID